MKNESTPDRELKAEGHAEIATQSSYAFPMSFAQQRLWFLDQFEPGNTLYNIVWPMRLRGHLNVEALGQSLNEIARRHEVLRATFRTIDDQPLQVIAPWQHIPLVIEDLTSLSTDEKEAEIQRLAQDAAETPISLQQGPMLRARLARLADEEHALILTLHHIVGDRWSRGIFFRELGALYEAFSQGKPSPLPELPLQYTDFAVWQREWLSGNNLEKQLSYWKQELAGAPASLELPTDRARPALASFHGRVYSFDIPREQMEALNAFSRREGVTLFMLVLAAFQGLLARYSGQEEVVVGTPIANRNRAELEDLIGFFANTLALRTSFAGNPTFRELLARVRETALGAYAHPDLPFEKLVEELNPERSLSHSPLFQVLLAVQNAPKEELRLSGLTLQNIPVRATGSKFDLALFLTETADGARGRLEYNTDLFEEQTVARMAGHLQQLLREAAANPDRRISDYELLTESERRQLLLEWNATSTHYPNRCVHELFEEQTRKTPQSVAVQFGSECLTYAELEARSNQLARYLRRQGVDSENLVGLYLDRSLEMMVALLGVLKAGGAYVPLDPAFPKERIRFIIGDSGVTTLITQTHLLSSMPEHSASVLMIDSDWHRISGESAEGVFSGAVPKNLAYVLYTSGSTGKPKGVEITHSAAVNFLLSMQRAPGFTPADTILAVTTLSFDIAGLELFLPLVTGGRVVIAGRDDTLDPARLMERMRDSACSVMQATPALWRALIAAGWSGSARLKVLCGGETLPPDLAQALLPRCAELWNMYGPTETTIWSTIHRVTSADGQVPIGRPIANTQVYVLDAHRQPTPPGVAGELYIGGAGLARGYLRRDELTRERFVASPFAPNARLYRTGDLARWLLEGGLEWLGRLDHQVKVRGFRIEPGEIEAAIKRHPAVGEVVVVAREDAGDKHLVAYFVAARPPADLVDQLRTLVRAACPEYMVPAYFVRLDALPRTANGKLDRKALPAPDLGATGPRAQRVAPRTPTEQTVMAVFSAVLERTDFGVDDSFFDLGGHSLMAARLMAQLRAVSGVDLPLRSLFECPSVVQLADAIDAVMWSTRRHTPIEVARQREEIEL